MMVAGAIHVGRRIVGAVVGVVGDVTRDRIAERVEHVVAVPLRQRDRIFEVLGDRIEIQLERTIGIAVAATISAAISTPVTSAALGVGRFRRGRAHGHQRRSAGHIAEHLATRDAFGQDGFESRIGGFVGVVIVMLM